MSSHITARAVGHVITAVIAASCFGTAVVVAAVPSIVSPAVAAASVSGTGNPWG
jgi:uncharacterized membrane protein YqgA involved in biofilm formation